VTTCLPDVLTPAERQAILKLMAEAPFVPGRITAFPLARDRKHNLQIDRARCPEIGRIDRVLIDALCRVTEFNRLTLPRRFAPPLYVRYEPGMTYGEHIDAAILGSGTPDPMRIDIAVTVFLSDASEYDGGELALETSFGEHEVKLSAGSAVVYPATTLHQVRPVTRGVRLVAVTWVQSWVPDGAAREILADIARAAELVVQRDPSGSRESMLLSRAYSNLLRCESEG
jgi:PKHD-type hydroxylase